MFKSGIRAYCEDCDMEEFILQGDGDKLMDFINGVDDVCNHAARFVITDKGREHLKQLKKLEDENIKDY